MPTLYGHTSIQLYPSATVAQILDNTELSPRGRINNLPIMRACARSVLRSSQIC